MARFNENYFKKNFKKIPKKCRLVPLKFHEILRKNSADFDKFSPKDDQGTIIALKKYKILKVIYCCSVMYFSMSFNRDRYTRVLKGCFDETLEKVSGYKLSCFTKLSQVN